VPETRVAPIYIEFKGSRSGANLKAILTPFAYVPPSVILEICDTAVIPLTPPLNGRKTPPVTSPPEFPYKTWPTGPLSIDVKAMTLPFALTPDPGIAVKVTAELTREAVYSVEDV
jgi:hypothetical protein